MVCEFCGKEVSLARGNFTRHVRYCKKNPNRIPPKKRTIPEEIRKKISEGMKKAHAEGRAHNIGECRWNNKPSYPEQWFIKVIKNEGLDNEYIKEMPFHKFSLDFAWPKKKVCLEIDGEQHDRFEEQRKRDLEKDRLLKEEGWLELRASWIWICNNSKDFISSVKKLLKRQLPIEEIEAMKVFLLSNKEKQRLEDENRKKQIAEAKKNGTLTKDGKLSGNKLSFDELNRRKEIILNCGVDLTKYGCLSEIEKVTELTRRQIKNTMKYFNIKYRSHG